MSSNYVHKNFFYYTIADLNKNFDVNVENNKLKILQINARGMNCLNKFDKIKDILSLYTGNVDIVVVGETWLKESNTNLYSIDGFRSFFFLSSGLI